MLLYIFIKSKAPSSPKLYYAIYNKNGTLLEKKRIDYNKEIKCSSYGTYDLLRYILTMIPKQYDNINSLVFYSCEEVVINQLNQDCKVKKLLNPYNNVIDILENIDFEVIFKFIPQRQLKLYL